MSVSAHESPLRKSDDWITPQHVIEGLGEPFDLDPCMSVTQPWPTASKGYTVTEDGLEKEWDGEVWLNPPYSNAKPWISKLANHNNGIALIFARTETVLWFEHIWPKSIAILFLRGRLFFCRPDGKRAVSPNGSGNAGAPSVLVAYGRKSLARLMASSLPGRLCILGET